MVSQMISGKAFEYALLIEFKEKLDCRTRVSIKRNETFNIALNCFEQLTSSEKSRYLLTASFSVNFLLDIEPRLSHDLNENDILELEILSDQVGVKGDVRDILILRALQKWEIGISAKNNNKAVKHPRLSQTIDFGKQWIDIPCSQSYFEEIKPFFLMLKQHKDESNGKKLWGALENTHELVYQPILNAFKSELMRLYSFNKKKVAENLITYLIGHHDFYKVIQQRNAVEIHAYNLHGTLNQPFKHIAPKFITPQTSLPSEILEIKYKTDSRTTLIVTFNHGWELSLRIHNASSRIEPSLKFDVNLIASPKSLFKNTLQVQES